MADIASRLVNVIETRQGDDIVYFTLEGVMIGGFAGGIRITPPEPKEPATIRGGIVKSPTPEQVRRQHDREAESLQTPESRLKHLQEDVA